MTQSATSSDLSQTAPPSTQYRGSERIPPKRKKAPGAARYRQPGEPRQEYFLPGFTVTSNTLLDDAEIRLSYTQERVFKWVQRFTTGFCREWCRVKVSAALEWTGLARSPYYRARKDLMQLELIEVRRDLHGNTWVRLSPRFQPLKPDYLASLDPPEFGEPPSPCPQIRDTPSPRKRDKLSPQRGRLPIHA